LTGRALFNTGCSFFAGSSEGGMSLTTIGHLLSLASYSHIIQPSRAVAIASPQLIIHHLLLVHTTMLFANTLLCCAKKKVFIEKRALTSDDIDIELVGAFALADLSMGAGLKNWKPVGKLCQEPIGFQNRV
jgi:hypothetical protein